jgi:hypothetical protein
MKIKKLLIMLIILFFILSYTRVSHISSPSTGLDGDSLISCMASNVDITDNKDYENITFTGYLEIHGVNINVTFSNCTLNLDAYLDIYLSSNVLFHNCTFAFTVPFAIYGASTVTIANSTLTLDSVAIYENATVVIQDQCTVTSSGDLAVTGASTVLLEDCSLTLENMYLEGGASVDVTGGTINCTGEIQFLNSTEGTFSGCAVETGAFRVGITPPVLGVKSGYPSAAIALLETNVTIRTNYSYIGPFHRAFFCGNTTA